MWPSSSPPHVAQPGEIPILSESHSKLVGPSRPVSWRLHLLSVWFIGSHMDVCLLDGSIFFFVRYSSPTDDDELRADRSTEAPCRGKPDTSNYMPLFCTQARPGHPLAENLIWWNPHLRMAVEERHVGPIIAFPKERRRDWMWEQHSIGKWENWLLGKFIVLTLHPPQSHISSHHPFTYPKSMVPAIVPPQLFRVPARFYFHSEHSRWI